MFSYCSLSYWQLILVLVPILVSDEYVAAFGPITVFDTAMAVLIGAVPAAIAAVLVYRSPVEPSFLLKVFLVALLLRVLVGTVIFVSSAQTFFGGDAYTYDWLGFELTQAWNGNRYSEVVVNAFVNKAGAAWGMIYYVGGVMLWLAAVTCWLCTVNATCQPPPHR